jgi:hypothetical protein
MTSREQDKGRPPPRISSKEAMPEDVRIVEDENGEGRVPVGRLVVIALVFLLKVDMVQPNQSLSLKRLLRVN